MSALGMTLTVLATELANAVAKDEAPAECGCDVSAGMYGPNASAWLRDLAAQLDASKREAAAYKWGYERLQARLRSVGRHGWADDYNAEILFRTTVGSDLVSGISTQRTEP